jgi:hypothetical protein
VVGLFESVTLESFGNFGITFTVGLTGHGQIHTYLGALSFEVVLQAGPDFGVAALGNAQHMLCGILGLVATFFDFYKFFGLGMANRTFCRGIFAFVYIAAHQASEFLFHIGYVFMCFDKYKKKFAENHYL